MTDKKLKVNSAAYTELSIQIAVLQASVDKLLDLAMNSEPRKVDIYYTITGVEGGSGSIKIDPLQWPNESLTDYLKRMGQYNKAQSDDEYYGETYK